MHAAVLCFYFLVQFFLINDSVILLSLKCSSIELKVKTLFQFLVLFSYPSGVWELFWTFSLPFCFSLFMFQLSTHTLGDEQQYIIISILLRSKLEQSVSSDGYSFWLADMKSLCQSLLFITRSVIMEANPCHNELHLIKKFKIKSCASASHRYLPKCRFFNSVQYFL